MCSFHDKTHAVIFEHNCLKLEACAGWFIWGGQELWESQKRVSPSLGWKSVISCGILLFGNPPTPPAASFLQSRAKSLLISWKGGTVCELCELLHPFYFIYWGFILCYLGWLRSGTNTKQTLLLSNATLERKKSKEDTLRGGGGSHRSRTHPTFHQWIKLKWGCKRETNMVLPKSNRYKPLRKINYWEEKEPRRKENKRDIYELFLGCCFFVQACRRRCNRNHFDDAIFLFAWSFASLVFQIVILRVSVEPVYIAVVSNVFWFCCLFRQNFQ